MHTRVLRYTCSAQPSSWHSYPGLCQDADCHRSDHQDSSDSKGHHGSTSSSSLPSSMMLLLLLAASKGFGPRRMRLLRRLLTLLSVLLARLLAVEGFRGMMTFDAELVNGNSGGARPFAPKG